MLSSSSLYIEVSPLLASPLAGIGRYVARLIEALSRLTPLHLVNLAGGNLTESLKLSNALPHCQEIRFPLNGVPPIGADLDRWVRRLLQYTHYNFDRESAKQCSGVFAMLRPAERYFGREVCILYDFTPLILPWAHVPEIRNEFGRFFAETSNLCDKAVAISESTKSDASWLCSIPNDDVIVGYPGPSLCVQSHAFTGRVERRQDLILVISTLEPRKNGQFLLDWFLTTDVVPPSTELWWAGSKGWLSDLSVDTRPLRSRGRRVKFLGMVADKHLCELYQRVAFTVYPSLYEGFGFPVLDSLIHGAPVLSSFNSSLQEFAGDGVFYFDPYDASSLDRACGELLANLRLRIDRKDLKDRFSWNSLARTVISLSKC